jgi:tRNA(Ile)-lysidine synthase
MRLPGGTKSLKKLYIDRKIPASQRPLVPVLADDTGVLAVYGIGPNRDRISSQGPAMQFVFTETGGNHA